MRVKQLRQELEQVALWLRHTEENGAKDKVGDDLRNSLMNIARDIEIECKRKGE